MNRKLQKIISLCIIVIFVFCDFSIDILYLKNFPVPYHIPLVNLQVPFSVPVIKLQSGSTAHADIYCLPPNGGQTPTFNQDIGFCTLPPLDEYGKCAAPYMYSKDYKTCVLNPMCTGGQYWDASTKQCVSPQTQGGGGSIDLGGSPSPDNKKYCMIDVNGNGTIEENEVFQCDQTPQGYICPQGQAECNPQYAQPTCPAGYTYDPATQKCVATISCPSGGSYDTSTDSCYATPGISCPSDYTYNSTDAKCEVAPGCAPGGTYNANTNQCEANSNPQCPTGYTYNSTDEKCESNPVCSQGTYNSSTDKCELSVSPTCSSPYTLEKSGSSNYVCYASPTCPTGSTYNTTTNKCETAGSASCPSGYSWNSNTQKCESYPQCPSGGSYNPSLDKCTTGTIASCPSGYTYNSSTGKCEASVTQGVCSSSQVPYTDYQCPATGKIYPDLTTCNNNCVQTAQCTSQQSWSTCTASAFPVNCYSGGADVITVSASPNSCATGSYNWGDGYKYDTACFNSSCYVTYNKYQDSTFNICTTSSISVSPSSSGTFSCDEDDYCSVTIKNTSTPTTTYTCPLGNYSCTGNPPTCSKGQTCVTHTDYTTKWYCNINGSYYDTQSQCTTNCHSACPSGGSYNSTTGKCEASVTTTCPAGYVLAGSYCVSNATCISPGKLNTATDKCETTPSTYNCPSGFTWNSTTKVCQKDPTCPQMGSVTGTLNTSNDKCEITMSYTCPSGMTYNSSVGKCQQDPTCAAGGNLNTGTDLCETAVNYNCPTGYTYTGGGKCTTPSSCSSGGTLNTTTDQCEANPVYSCPSGYTYTASSSGSSSGPSGVCQGAASCPSGGTLNTTTDRCEANANCSTGTLQSQGCFTGYSCPLGNYPCQQVGSQWLCSPNTCADIQDEGDLTPGGYENDGPKDQEGNCLGTIYIFNGKKMRCRLSGWDTGFHNCCNNSKGKMYDSTGSTGFTSIPDMIKAIAAVYAALKFGYYLANADHIVVNAIDKTVTIFTTSGGSVTYALDSAEGAAAQSVAFGQGALVNTEVSGYSYFYMADANPDNVVGAGLQNYIQNLGPQIAWAVAQLAISRVIKDPVLSSAVDLTGTIALMALGKIPVNYYMIAFEVISLVMALFSERCDQTDIMTSTLNDSKYCHEVGEYCAKKFPVIGCVQKAKGFCCFNSKLARIIHEQGRPQLAGFGPDGNWGDPKNPNCRGFLPEEFQALDFNKIDLSEYMEDIQRNMNQNMGKQMQEQFNKSMNDLMGK